MKTNDIIKTTIFTLIISILCLVGFFFDKKDSLDAEQIYEVFIDGKSVYLTPKEYDLLKYFIENKNIALSRENLLNNIWGYDFYGEDRTVDTHVKMLRSHIGKYKNMIKTVRGVGYKFEYKE